MEPERSLMRSWISDSAIVLAIITFCAHFAAFSLELGYYSYFRIPPELISLNLISILIYPTLPFIHGISFFIIVSILSIMITAAMMFIRRLFVPDPAKKGSSENNRFQSPGFYIPVGIAVCFVILSISGVFSIGLGKKSAKLRTEFQVIAPSSDVPEVAVLRISGDYLLTAPFDRVTKEVEKKLYILKISEMSKIPLTLEKIGPLTVKP